MKVLSTKTLDEEVIAYARSLNITIHCIDLIELKRVDLNLHAITHPVDAIAFTSANAVKYFLDDDNATRFIKGKNVFSLSGKTAQELSNYGIVPVLLAESATGLAGAIIHKHSAKSLLHVCSDQKLDVLEDELKNAGIKYTPLIVYQTLLRSNVRVSEPFDTVMFFSPSGIESFFKENNITDETVCCCIGQTTAEALRKRKSNAKIIASKQPSQTAMIDAMVEYFKNKAIK